MWLMVRVVRSYKQVRRSLYYQKYLTANVLSDKDAVFIPKILVCRGTEPYEFGNSVSEKRERHYCAPSMLSGAIAET